MEISINVLLIIIRFVAHNHKIKAIVLGLETEQT